MKNLKNLKKTVRGHYSINDRAVTIFEKSFTVFSDELGVSELGLRKVTSNIVLDPGKGEVIHGKEGTSGREGKALINEGGIGALPVRDTQVFKPSESIMPIFVGKVLQKLEQQGLEFDVLADIDKFTQMWEFDVDIDVTKPAEFAEQALMTKLINKVASGIVSINPSKIYTIIPYADRDTGKMICQVRGTI